MPVETASDPIITLVESVRQPIPPISKDHIAALAALIAEGEALLLEGKLDTTDH